MCPSRVPAADSEGNGQWAVRVLAWQTCAAAQISPQLRKAHIYILLGRARVGLARAGTCAAAVEVPPLVASSITRQRSRHALARCNGCMGIPPTAHRRVMARQGSGPGARALLTDAVQLHFSSHGAAGLQRPTVPRAPTPGSGRAEPVFSGVPRDVPALTAS